MKILRAENGKPSAVHSDKRKSRFLAFPNIINRESIPIAVMPDISYQESLLLVIPDSFYRESIVVLFGGIPATYLRG